MFVWTFVRGISLLAYFKHMYTRYRTTNRSICGYLCTTVFGTGELQTTKLAETTHRITFNPFFCYKFGCNEKLYNHTLVYCSFKFLFLHWNMNSNDLLFNM